jgi:HTH-type transcriptional regulator, quorum sensing regulator NprR
MVGDKIKFYRKRRGMTQATLADGICSIPYLSKIEQGKTECSDEIVTLLCRRLEIPEDEQKTLDDSEVENLLNAWSTSLNSDNLREIEAIYLKVKNAKQKISTPYLEMKFELLLLYQLIIQKKLIDADKQLALIETFSNDLPIHLTYDFHKLKAMLLLYKQDYKQSLFHYNQALHLIERSENKSSIETADLNYQIAVVHAYLSKLSLSNQFARKALKMFQSEYDFQKVINCLILLGVNYRRVNDFMQAKECYIKSLKIANFLKENRALSMIHHNLGKLYSSMNERRKSIEHLTESLDLDGLQKDEKIRTFYLLAKEHYELKELHLAKKWLTKGKKHLQKDQNIEYCYHFDILELEIISQCDESFVKRLVESIEWFTEKHFWFYVTEYAEKLATYYHNHSKYKNASEYYRIANEARKKIH